jgi:hypothetical protein
MTERAARLPVNFSTLIWIGHEEGSGTLVEISRTGARIEVERGPAPSVGSYVRLSVSGSREAPVELAAVVVRHTDRGFAVTFGGVTVELLSLLASLGMS